MREAFDGIKKIPHPEEAAKQLSRRTHGAGPADREFPYSRLRREDESRRIPVNKPYESEH
jgi:hypothetical protein